MRCDRPLGTKSGRLKVVCCNAAREVLRAASQMPLRRVVGALGLHGRASEPDIASAMRSLAGLSPQSGDPHLWVHLLDWFTLEVERPWEHQSSDLGHIGFAAMMSAIPFDDVTWTVERWAKELGLPPDRSKVGDWLAVYVSDYLGPCISRAGLLRAQPDSQAPLDLPST
jgi:hypothetical protein